MSRLIGASDTLFSDDFESQLDPNKWDYNRFESGGSFLGRTQMRQELPQTLNGALHLQVDTWLDGKAFSGSEAITKKSFGLANGGVAFEIKAKFVPPEEGLTLKGLVGGIFPFSYNANTKLHDEIDWEALGNDAAAGLKEIQTNVYANEPFGAGKVQFVDISSALTDWHTYRIEWLPDQVRWIVDSQVLRVEKQKVPKGEMELHLNFWAPAAEWGRAFDVSLQPAKTAADNKQYWFDVDSVQVLRLATQYGSDGRDTLSGPETDDWIVGYAGSDRLQGAAGDDTLFGGRGNDELKGGSGDDVMRGGRDDDRLNGHAGDDGMKGGDGADTFVFGADLAVAGIDRIGDFEVGIDTIRLKSVVFTELGAPGPLAKAAFQVGAAAVDADDRIIYDSQDGRLLYDSDGSGPNAGIQFAKLSSGLALTHTDFGVV